MQLDEGPPVIRLRLVANDAVAGGDNLAVPARTESSGHSGGDQSEKQSRKEPRRHLVLSLETAFTHGLRDKCGAG
jgi:hypothetical protein